MCKCRTYVLMTDQLKTDCVQINSINDTQCRKKSKRVQHSLVQKIEHETPMKCMLTIGIQFNKLDLIEKKSSQFIFAAHHQYENYSNFEGLQVKKA